MNARVFSCSCLRFLWLAHTSARFLVIATPARHGGYPSVSSVPLWSSHYRSESDDFSDANESVSAVDDDDGLSSDLFTWDDPASDDAIFSCISTNEDEERILEAMGAVGDRASEELVSDDDSWNNAAAPSPNFNVLETSTTPRPARFFVDGNIRKSGKRDVRLPTSKNRQKPSPRETAAVDDGCDGRASTNLGELDKNCAVPSSVPTVVGFVPNLAALQISAPPTSWNFSNNKNPPHLPKMTSKSATASTTETQTSSGTTSSSVSQAPTMTAATPPTLPFDEALLPRNESPVAATPNSSTHGSTISPFVREFLPLTGHWGLLPIPLDYLTDPFNLAQLAPVLETIMVEVLKGTPYVLDKSKRPALFREAWELLTSSTASLAPSANNKIDNNADNANDSRIYHIAASVLYCLVHQRYVLSPRGLLALRTRLQKREFQFWFGRCPRPSCQGRPLLPAGPVSYQVGGSSGRSRSVSTSRGSRSSSRRDSSKHSNSSSGGRKRSSAPPHSNFRYCGHCQHYWAHWGPEYRRHNNDENEDNLMLGRYVQGCAWGPSLGPLYCLSFEDPDNLDDAILDILPNEEADQAARTTPLALASPAKMPSTARIFGFRLHDKNKKLNTVD